MSELKMNPKVDEYIINSKKWRPEIVTLRQILLGCDLTEELKWKSPCYTFKKSNVAMIGSYKEYCCLSFLKGTLLNDQSKVLESPGENSQAVRLVKFKAVEQIDDLKDTLMSYVQEAIEIEQQGKKLIFKKEPESIPPEFQIRMNNDQALKNAFDELTQGRKRGYILYFSAAKQSKSRESRIDKYTDRILSGKGINDCVCGLSKRLPNCDGSHKQLQ